MTHDRFWEWSNFTECWSLYYQPTGHLWGYNIPFTFTVTLITTARYVLTISPRLGSVSMLMLRCKKSSRYNGKGARNWLVQLQLAFKSPSPQGVPENLRKHWWPQAGAQDETGGITQELIFCGVGLCQVSEGNRQRESSRSLPAGWHTWAVHVQQGQGCVRVCAHWCAYTQSMNTCRLTQGERSRMDKEQPHTHNQS